MFEKYKRPLFLALTLFALVTFSITGAIYAYVARLGQPSLGTILVPVGENGSKTIELTMEDQQMGMSLARMQARLLQMQLPWRSFVFADLEPDFTQDPTLVFAILRRVAIERGIDVSDEETDKAVLELVSKVGGDPRQLARALGVGDESSLRLLVREGLKISILVHLEQLAGTDLSAAAQAEALGRKRKLLELQYLEFSSKEDEKKLLENPPDDGKLSAWIASLSKDDQTKYGFVDPVHVRFDGVALLEAEAKLEEFAEELKDYEDPSEEDLETRYNFDRDRLYVRPDWKEPGKDASGDGGGKRDEDGGLLQDPQGGAGSGGQGGGETTKPPAKPQPMLPPTPEQAKYRPFQEVKEDVKRRMKLEAVVERLLDQARKASEEAGEKTGSEGKEDSKDGAASSFDLKAWFEKIAKGRKGLTFLEPGELKAPEEYKELGVLGRWEGFWALGSVSEVGMLSAVQTAEKGMFFFHLLEREMNVLKPLASIRDEARKTWAKLEAKKKAKKRAERFLELMRKKAEALVPEKVASIRKRIEEEVGKKFEAWKSSLEKDIAEKKKMLESPDLVKRAIPLFKKQLAKLEKELSRGEDERASIRKEIEKKLDPEIVEAIAPKLGEAFAEAAKVAGLEIRTLGPFFDDASSDPLFSLKVKGAAAFLEAEPSIRDLEEGRVSDVLEDATEGVFYVCRLAGKKEAGLAGVDRRHLLNEWFSFSRERLLSVLRNSYNLVGLKKRFAFQASR